MWSVGVGQVCCVELVILVMSGFLIPVIHALVVELGLLMVVILVKFLTGVTLVRVVRV